MLCYLLLFLATLNLFVFKRGWIWGPLIFLSVGVAYHDHVIDLYALIPIAIIFALNLILAKELRGWARFMIVVLIIGCSIPLLFHVFPGFHNPIIAKAIALSKRSVPLTFYFNFDKPFTGFFTIALILPHLRDRLDFRRAFLAPIPLIILTIAVLIVLALLFHFIHFEPKYNKVMWSWLLANLFLTAIPEEGFYRGLIQRELTHVLPRDWGPVLGVIIAALIFTLPHALILPKWEYLVLTFMAGIGYGTIYHLTQAIESAILCHFLVNAIHFIFFTYPFSTQ